MSLRSIVIFLLIANLGYFAYGQGWLIAIVGSDSSQREPERISRQVNPDAIVISQATDIAATLPAGSTPEVSQPASEPATAETSNTCTAKREQWLIYMGPYATKLLRDQKKAELNGLAVPSAAISKQSLKLGLSLGEFESEASAKQALTDLNTKGVKTATVVLWGVAACAN